MRLILAAVALLALGAVSCGEVDDGPATAPPSTPTPMPTAVPTPSGPTASPEVRHLEPLHPLNGWSVTTVGEEEVRFDWTATTPPYKFTLMLEGEAGPVEEVNDLLTDSLMLLLPQTYGGTYLWYVTDGEGNTFPPVRFSHQVVFPTGTPMPTPPPG